MVRLACLLVPLTLALTACSSSAPSESAAWSEARGVNTPEGYASFLRHFPDARKTPDARSRHDDLRIRAAVRDVVISDSDIERGQEIWSDYTVTAIEDTLLEQLKENGPLDRVCIPYFRPNYPATEWLSKLPGRPRATVKIEAEKLVTFREFLDDLVVGWPKTYEGRTMKSFSWSGPGRPARPVERPLKHLGPFLFATETLETVDTIGIDGAIHRFDGPVNIDDYLLVGTGGKHDRLTFALTEAFGYVYLRGSGRVIFPDGNVIEFPPSSAVAYD